MDFVLHEGDKDGNGETRLTTESTASSYGLPVLRITQKGQVRDYGPADALKVWRPSFSPAMTVEMFQEGPGQWQPARLVGVHEVESKAAELKDDVGVAFFAANLVKQWAEEFGRTAEEVEAARMFLSQWPHGPQLA